MKVNTDAQVVGFRNISKCLERLERSASTALCNGIAAREQRSVGVFRSPVCTAELRLIGSP